MWVALLTGGVRLVVVLVDRTSAIKITRVHGLRAPAVLPTESAGLQSINLLRYENLIS